MKGELRKIDFASAFDYACEETYSTLKNLKKTNDYDKVLNEVKEFLTESKQAIRKGSNALKERDRALRLIISPG